jgi:hypothetical protein
MRARGKFRPTVAGLAVVALLPTMAVVSGGSANAAPGSVLLVVATPSLPTATESALTSRLQAAGRTVTLADDDTVTAAQAAASSFALISSSVSSNSANVVTQLSGSAKPVWVAKPYLLDNFGLTGPAAESDYGNVSTRTAVIAAGHPMAAGRSGTVTLFSANQTIGWGRMAPAATAVATVTVAGAQRQAAFVVPKGGALTTQPAAPGCRLTFPLPGSPTAATADYWSLFDATTQYAVDGCGTAGPVDPPAGVRVLLVTADPAAQTGADNVVSGRLRQSGATVTVADDNSVDVQAANASTYVVISPSVNSAAVGASVTLTSTSRPVWVAKPYLLDNYGLAGNRAETDYGNVSVRTATVIGGHPMAAGRSGAVTLFGSNQGIGWARPPTAATQVLTAATPGGVRATGFVVESGQQLAAGGAAPGCRLTLPVPATAATATADYWALFDATAQYAGAGCTAAPPQPVDGALVLLISVDGLNPDAITTLGTTGTPALHRLMTEGVSTLNARSTFESTQTLPNHTSMITGRPVTEPGGHGVLFNEDNGSTVHVSAGGYVAGAFDVAHDNGLPTSLYVGKTKFDFLDRSWNATNGAPDTTGADNGRDKIDSYVVGTGGTNTPALISRMQAGLAGFVMLHFHEPDGAGHASGYMSQPYLEAVTRTDAWIGQLLTAIAADPALAARTTVVVTSDHGGLGTSHADASQPVNYRVPFFAWGNQVGHGADLYALNPDRTDPGTGRPTYTVAGQPVRSAEAGNLVTELLGLGVVPGSRINTNQSLDLKAG